jgi:DNA ligase-associated metallophosphoesterase
MFEIELRGEQIFLLPECAVWWPAQKTLILSDMHWGKGGHFRKHGIAIPVNAQANDEAKLAKLVTTYKADRLIIAGDMFHSRNNKEVDMFVHWRDAHAALQIDLVAGNHDILPAEKYQKWNLNFFKDDYFIGPFLIAHDEVPGADTFVIHGHVHPAVRISGRGNQSFKLCCYCQDERRMILPSFGQFTGSHIVSAEDYKHIYVIAEDNVIQWK